MILVTGATGLSGHFIWHDLLSEIIRLSGATCQIVHKPLTDMSPSERTSRRFYCQTWRYDDGKLREVLAFTPSRTWQQTAAEALSSTA